MEDKKQEGIELVVDDSVTCVYGIPVNVQQAEIKAYCSGACGLRDPGTLDGGAIGLLVTCEVSECKFLDGQMLESCGVTNDGNPVFLRKLIEFVEESNDAANILAQDLVDIHLKELYEKFKNGDWVTGIDKHKGCSEVFIGDDGELQPFSWLDDYNPDHYRLSTQEEIDHVKAHPRYVAADKMANASVGDKKRSVFSGGMGTGFVPSGMRFGTKILTKGDIAALKRAEEKRKMRGLKRLATRIDN
ncbi:hypothetical protein KAR91_33780 [Candidatus Pacearchaeota archaeon]|nr:hypothetical protein [Candidatus Pacearchaeota archaeon]